MQKPILPIAPIVFSSLSFIPRSWLWFVVIPGFLSAISAFVLPLFGFSASLALSVFVSILSTLFALSASFAIANDLLPSWEIVTKNFVPRYIALLTYQLITSFLAVLVILVTGSALFADLVPELTELGDLGTQLLQTSNDQAAMGLLTSELIKLFDAATLQMMLERLLLVVGFSLLLSFVFVAFFIPIYGVIVAEDLRWGAVSRAISLTAGYRLKIVGIFIVLVFFFVILSAIAGVIAGLLTVLAGGILALYDVITAFVFAPIVSWITIAIGQIYCHLREIQAN